MMSRKQHLLVIAAGIVRRLDDQESVHPGVQASAQIGPGNIVAVIPTCAGGLRRERVTSHGAALYHRRSFLHRAIGSYFTTNPKGGRWARSFIVVTVVE